MKRATGGDPSHLVWRTSVVTCPDGSRTGSRRRYVQDLHVIDAHVRRQVRAIIVRQKKQQQRFLFRHLQAKGVSVKAAAGCAYCGKGAWAKSNHPAMTRAYPSWFDGRMKSLKALWQRLHTPLVSAQLVLGF